MTDTYVYLPVVFLPTLVVGYALFGKGINGSNKAFVYSVVLLIIGGASLGRWLLWLLWLDVALRPVV